MIKLKGYTTSVPVNRSVNMIENALAKHGAKKILKDFENSEIIGISFLIETETGLMAIKLPANYQKVYACLFPNQIENEKNMAQAKRVSWRVILHWLEAQLSLVAIKMAKIHHVFLPYATNAEGKTIVNLLDEGKLNQLQLEMPKESNQSSNSLDNERVSDKK